LKYIAIFLFLVCAWDLVFPFFEVLKAKQNSSKKWVEVIFTYSFIKYAFSVVVNILAIYFFLVYIYAGRL